MFFGFLGNYWNLNEKMWKGILCIWVVLNFDNNLYYCSCNLGEKKILNNIEIFYVNYIKSIS